MIIKYDGIEIDFDRVMEMYGEKIFNELTEPQPTKVLARIWEEIELPKPLKFEVEECLKANGYTLFSKVN